MDRLAAVVRWIVITFLVVAALEVLAIPLFYLAAFVGDYTGWYRVEDYMCTISACR